MRQQLVYLLIDVHHQFDLSNETFYLCIDLLDRYLSVSSISSNKLKLAGYCALWIACKYQDIGAPQIDDFVSICDNAFNSDELKKFESIMVSKLDFKVHYTTELTTLVNNYLKIIYPNTAKYKEFERKNLTYYATLTSGVSRVFKVDINLVRQLEQAKENTNVEEKALQKPKKRKEQHQQHPKKTVLSKRIKTQDSATIHVFLFGTSSPKNGCRMYLCPLGKNKHIPMHEIDADAHIYYIQWRPSERVSDKLSEPGFRLVMISDSEIYKFERGGKTPRVEVIKAPWDSNYAQSTDFRGLFINKWHRGWFINKSQRVFLLDFKNHSK